MTPPAARAPGRENRCPVCQALFRGARVCSRCGADLGTVMRLAGQAWRLRETARRRLEAGRIDEALTLAGQAQQLQATRPGAALERLAAWLAAGR